METYFRVRKISLSIAISSVQLNVGNKISQVADISQQLISHLILNVRTILKCLQKKRTNIVEIDPFSLAAIVKRYRIYGS